MGKPRDDVSGSDLAPQFKALSDPTRLAVLARLSAQPVCVCELAEVLAVPQPLLSFHLRTLRVAGLVRVTRRGRWSHYALDEGTLDVVVRFLSELANPVREPAMGACCGTAATRPAESVI
jgi:ArsR family transcriptional regulator